MAMEGLPDGEPAIEQIEERRVVDAQGQEQVEVTVTTPDPHVGR